MNAHSCFAPHNLLRMFPYTNKVHIPRYDTTHSGLVPPTSITYHKMHAQTCPQGQSDGCDSSSNESSAQVSIVFVMLTKTTMMLTKTLYLMLSL